MPKGYISAVQFSVILTLMLLSIVRESSSRPSHNSIRADGCEISLQIRTLCQQCAKATKSILVYPMCCGNTESARPWCGRYINYGLHTPS